MFKVIALVIIIAAVLPLYAQAQVPGDVNCSYSFNGLDVTYLVSYLLATYQTYWFDSSSCAWPNGDLNGDGYNHTIADWWNIINYWTPVGDHPLSPYEIDSLSIQEVYAAPGDTVSLPVYSFSLNLLSGVMVHFHYEDTQIQFLDFSYSSQYFDVEHYYEEEESIINFQLAYQTPLEPGTHRIGEISVVVSAEVPPGTDIELELISEDYYPSGFGNYSTPTYFIQPTLVNGIIHVVTTGIDESEPPGAKEINLSNYPNPFNASTRIEFVLTKHSLVELIIYDLLGQRIETLVENEMLAGRHQIVWNASKYPSGLYFYRIKAENYIETKKMVLLK